MQLIYYILRYLLYSETFNLFLYENAKIQIINDINKNPINLLRP